jgi:hypothetical protein
MKRSFAVIVVSLLALGLFPHLIPVPNAAVCPTYQTNLIVDLVDSTPTTVSVGATVVTRVHVAYSDGTPAILYPETLSFLWHGSAGDKTVRNVPVVPTGDPGFYTYTQTIAEDFPTGLVTVFVLFCCASDNGGNFGPTDDVSSDITITLADNSKVEIGPLTTEVTTTTTRAPTLQELLATYAVPIAIVVLVIIALLLLAVRTRGKKKK